MDTPETIHQAYALITRKHDGVDELMLVEELDGEMSFPGGAQEEGDVDMISALRRELREELQLWPEQYEAKGTGVTLSFKYERPESSRFGKTGVTELFDVQLRPGVEPRVTGELKGLGWYAFDRAMEAVAHEGHRRLLLMAKEHIIK
ncbi:MAG: NUDIX domain-containing protein [Patescibacteria group bacterium]|nr:NUDIX domain-containing protein [Patescibacteria group bacterium]